MGLRGIQFFEAKPSRLAELPELVAATGSGNTCSKEHSHQRRIYVAGEQGDAIIGFCWVCPRSTVFAASIIKPGAAEVDSSEKVIAESWQQQGLDIGLEHAIFRLVERKGCQIGDHVVDFRRGRDLNTAVVSRWTVTRVIPSYRDDHAGAHSRWQFFGEIYPYRLLYATDGGPQTEQLLGLCA